MPGAIEASCACLQELLLSFDSGKEIDPALRKFIFKAPCHNKSTSLRLTRQNTALPISSQWSGSPGEFGHVKSYLQALPYPRSAHPFGR